jgi:hypothetical protein
LLFEFYLNLVKQRVSELLLFDSKRAIFQPYHDENKLHFNKMIMSHFVLDQHTLNFSANSMKQQYVGRHLAALWIMT